MLKYILIIAIVVGRYDAVEHNKKVNCTLYKYIIIKIK